MLKAVEPKILTPFVQYNNQLPNKDPTKKSVKRLDNSIQDNLEESREIPRNPTTRLAQSPIKTLTSRSPKVGKFQSDQNSIVLRDPPLINVKIDLK